MLEQHGVLSSGTACASRAGHATVVAAAAAVGAADSSRRGRCLRGGHVGSDPGPHVAPNAALCHPRLAGQAHQLRRAGCQKSVAPTRRRVSRRNAQGAASGASSQRRVARRGRARAPCSASAQPQAAGRPRSTTRSMQLRPSHGGLTELELGRSSGVGEGAASHEPRGRRGRRVEACSRRPPYMPGEGEGESEVRVRARAGLGEGEGAPDRRRPVWTRRHPPPSTSPPLAEARVPPRCIRPHLPLLPRLSHHPLHGLPLLSRPQQRPSISFAFAPALA